MLDVELDQGALAAPDDEVTSLLGHVLMLETFWHVVLIAQLSNAKRLMQVVFDRDSLQSMEAYFEGQLPWLGLR